MWSSATTPDRRLLAVVTDVDGCILDANTYAPGPARATLHRLRRRGIPVVLCTSKTRAEVAALSRELGLRLPAIIESGAAILVPPGTLRPPAGTAGRRTRDGLLVPLAQPIAEVRAGLADLERITRGGVRGFGDMTAREIGTLAGLLPAAARRAARREFDEPFVFTADPRQHRPAIRRALARRRLRITRGGRFHHLHGETDKGRAVRLVRGWLAAASGGGAPRILALGDGPHDLPFLRAADLAVVVPRPDGAVDPLLRRNLPRARRAPAPGPAGTGGLSDST